MKSIASLLLSGPSARPSLMEAKSLIAKAEQSSWIVWQSLKHFLEKETLSEIPGRERKSFNDIPTSSQQMDRFLLNTDRLFHTADCITEDITFSGWWTALSANLRKRESSMWRQHIPPPMLATNVLWHRYGSLQTCLRLFRQTMHSFSSFLKGNNKDP